MILVDIGPLVALFDPQDEQHDRCVKALKAIKEPLVTTIPVLTEAFHMLEPASIGSDRLRSSSRAAVCQYGSLTASLSGERLSSWNSTQTIRWIWRTRH